MNFTSSKNMKAVFLSCILISPILVACGGSGQNSPLLTVPVAPPATVIKDVRPGTWIILGSSTASGTGATPGNSWADLLRANLKESGASVTNLARGGTVSYSGLASGTISPPNRPVADSTINISQAISRNPVVIIISYPTNDVASGYRPEETINNINSIRTSAMNAGVPAIVLSTQPRDFTKPQLENLQEIDRKLSADVGGCFVSIRESLSGSDGKLLPEFNSGDGVHPNDAGHKLIFTKLLATIKSETCIRQIR